MSTLYDVHPSVAYAQAIIDNLPGRTGRTIDEWVRLLERSAVTGSTARRDWLKKEHGLGATTAGLVVARAEGTDAESTDAAAYIAIAEQHVESMYAGAKSHLRAIHDVIIDRARALGDDVRVCPCATIVPLYRSHVFAQIKPSTRTRIDLGLALKGTDRKPTARLIDTGGLAKGDRITHRIAISEVSEVDGFVMEWLREAYGLDG